MTVHRLPSPDAVAREASEWIARLEADDVCDDDRKRFEAWRAAHPAHARAYEELCCTWKELLAAGGAWLDVLRPLKPGTTFSTAIGEHARVSLPDGSTLDLNSGSLARVDYSGAARVIRLERGEGFFEVVHDAHRPFWVLAGGSWVRAVGTAFNVYLHHAGVEVTVSEGMVRVGSAQRLANGARPDETLAAAATAVLTAGEQADIEEGVTATRQLSTAQVQRSLTWREGTVYFENRPLGEVIAELDRYTTLKVAVRDQSLARLPVGGTFRTSPEGAEALLSMLEHGFGLRVHHEDERAVVELKARSSQPE